MGPGVGGVDSLIHQSFPGNAFQRMQIEDGYFDIGLLRLF